MIHPSEPHTPEEFINSLDEDDLKRLAWLLRVVARIEGWCSINRTIGKWIFATIISLLLIGSQVVDAFKNLFGFKH